MSFAVFKMSTVLLGGLRTAGLDPNSIMDTYDERVLKRIGPFTADDEVSCRLSEATGLKVFELSRHNRVLLLDVQCGPIYYEERSLRDVRMTVFGTSLPETMLGLCAGRQLLEVVDLGPTSKTFAGCRVIRAESGPGTLSMSIDPGWTALQRSPSWHDRDTNICRARLPF